MSDIKNIHEDDLDDIIKIAAALQNKDENDHQISIKEVEEVARELGISPEKVKEALSFLEKQRAEEKQQKEEARRLQKTRRLLLTGGLCALMCITGTVLLGLASSADSTMGDLQTKVYRAEANVKVAIDRQASLIPQLLVMMGGDLSSIETLQDQLLEAETLQKKMDISQQLNREIAKAIATLPPAQNDADNQARLNYQYEVTGAQNRISTEQKRYDSAMVEWKSEGTSLGSKIALMLGWIEAPPE